MDWKLMPYGVYVAFAFSCILFGGLAYRQVVDSLELRASRTGEDLSFFVSAPGTYVLACAVILLAPLSWMCYAWIKPSIWSYALPLILAAQTLQLGLRLYFQRLRFRTLAIVQRFVLRSGVRVVMYESIREIRVSHKWLWTEIEVETDADERATFRIFRSSEAEAIDRLRSLSGRSLSVAHSR